MTLSPDFTRHIHEAIRAQAARPWDSPRANAQAAEVRNRWPSSEAKAAAAMVRCVGRE